MIAQLGLGLALGNWLGLVVPMGVVLWLYAYRMEDAAMLAAFGERTASTAVARAG